MTAAICRRLFGCVRSRLDAVGVYGIYSCSITKIFNIFKDFTERISRAPHGTIKKMKIAIASDHGGYAFRDFGCYSTDSMDYPDIAFPAAEAVASGEFDRGILICGTGIGVSICANKVRGIRCALCGDVLSAELTRQHNDSNMLAMGGRIIGIETAKAIVKTWLCTEFAGGRHERRIGKISDYECR